MAQDEHRGHAEDVARPDVAPREAADVVARLRQGNQRFIKGQLRPRSDAPELRRRLADVSPRPVAVVVTCSDPRVCPELILDTKLGELFVVRTAGNVVDDVALGSVEFAVEALDAPVVVVLGHERCGAVAAALAGRRGGPALDAVLAEIRPSVELAAGDPDPVARCEDENIRHTIARLRADERLGQALKPESIVGAKYHMESGVVDFRP